MNAFKCPGQDSRFWKPEDVFDAICPHCGVSVEFFKDDRKRRCPSCKNPMVNPRLDLGCLEWCQYADKCQALTGEHAEKGADHDH